MKQLITNEFYELIESEINTAKGLSTVTINKILNSSTVTEEWARLKKTQGRYANEKDSIPVLTRTFLNSDGTIDNDSLDIKLNIDYWSDIVNVKGGYTFGNPIVYKLSKDFYSESELKTKEEWLNRQLRILDMPDLDNDQGIMCGNDGYSVRINYTDSEGIFRMKTLDSTQIIFVSKELSNIISPEYVLRYYEQPGKSGKDSFFEIYGNDKEWKYKKAGKALSYEIEENPIINPYGITRINGFPNNKIFMPDAQRVVNLIDAQDTLMSDLTSELASIRLAYLILKNVNIESDTFKEFRKSHALLVGAEGSIEFLTKQLSVDALKWTFETCHKLIYEMSNTVNFNSQFLSGQKTIAEVKTLLLPFETKCKNTELKYKKASRRSFEILFEGAKRASQETIDADALDMIFTRNFPENEKEETETAVLKKNLGISMDTILADLSYIDSPEEELGRMEAAREENMVNIDDPAIQNIMNRMDAEAANNV